MYTYAIESSLSVNPFTTHSVPEKVVPGCVQFFYVAFGVVLYRYVASDFGGNLVVFQHFSKLVKFSCGGGYMVLDQSSWSLE